MSLGKKCWIWVRLNLSLIIFSLVVVLVITITVKAGQTFTSPVTQSSLDVVIELRPHLYELMEIVSDDNKKEETVKVRFVSSEYFLLFRVYSASGTGPYLGEYIEGKLFESSVVSDNLRYETEELVLPKGAKYKVVKGNATLNMIVTSSDNFDVKLYFNFTSQLLLWVVFVLICIWLLLVCAKVWAYFTNK